LRQLEFLLGTLPAPRPVALDGAGLLRCLYAAEPEPPWYPHVEALSHEVSAEALYDVVLVGILTFDDLRHAAQTWEVTHRRLFPWVVEMAEWSEIRSQNLCEVRVAI
jgi:hypothetical protein